jgi:hypothetical protein
MTLMEQPPGLNGCAALLIGSATTGAGLGRGIGGRLAVAADLVHCHVAGRLLRAAFSHFASRHR